MSKKPFCPLPFTQMVFHPDGSVTPCCLLLDYNLGNLKEKSHEEIWNGPEVRALRREFLEGKPKTCAGSIRNRQCHLWHSHLVQKTQRSEVQTRLPVKMDVRLNGHCNLECIMCEVWEYPNGVYDQIGFWDFAQKDFFPHILELDVLGGEPFIQRDTFRLIRAVSSVNPDCQWALTTNGQWKFNPYVREHLDRIRIRRIIMSIDSVDPELYAKIRLRGDLNKSLRTLDDLREYRDSRAKTSPFSLRMEMLVQLENRNHVATFLEYARSKEIDVGLILLYHPIPMSVLSLAAAERRRLAEDYEALHRDTGEESLGALIRPLRASLDPERWIAKAISQKVR